mmetsp:Transcript_13533/g.23043  ORF Transcript_13533/g.23043 Transcript_13533/m.23043 type:complete len:97 (+) Transcript_13533:153-443(+)
MKEIERQEIMNERRDRRDLAIKALYHKEQLGRGKVAAAATSASRARGNEVEDDRSSSKISNSSGSSDSSSQSSSRSDSPGHLDNQKMNLDREPQQD